MPAPLFNGRYLIFGSVVGGTADFIVNGLFTDETSTFIAANVSAGDKFYDARGKKFTIIFVNTTSPLNCDVGDDEAAGAPVNPGSIYRPSDTVTGIPLPTREANGITEFLKLHMLHHALDGADVGGSGVIWQRDTFAIASGDLIAEKLTLTATPADADSVRVDVAGAADQIEGDDYIISGNEIQWTGLGLASLLSVGNRVEISYNR